MFFVLILCSFGDIIIYGKQKWLQIKIIERERKIMYYGMYKDARNGAWRCLY